MCRRRGRHETVTGTALYTDLAGSVLWTTEPDAEGQAVVGCRNCGWAELVAA